MTDSGNFIYGTGHGGVGFETSVLVLHAGVRVKTLLFDHTRWCWALHSGAGLYTPAFYSWRMRSGKE